MLTLAEYTRPLRPHIPMHIASHEAFERVLALTSYFPAHIANNLFVIETHLHQDDQFVDAFVFFPEGQMPLLPVGASDPDHSWYAHPAWRKMYRFFSVWCDPTSLIYKKTDQAWLSFDLNQPVPDVPIPGIFYCSIHPDCSIHPRTDLLPTVQLLSSIFNTPEESRLMTDTLMRCLEQMPAPAHLNHVGFGLNRSCGTIRLQIVDFPPQQIPAYLKAIGWRYSTAPLLPTLEQFSVANIPGLMFDISTHVHPKIGLECMLRGHDTQRWQGVFGYLVEQGLCQPEKRDFLLPYPGTKLCQMGEQMSLTRQRLSHVKIGYHPEHIRPFEAKAYLAYYPTWLSL
ncbi:MAG TPA: hypothetical protein VKR06_30885 [Ktedonosporobacter sp.]|nr:hypothetical protein [Ktedonosporobacter sp.]